MSTDPKTPVRLTSVTDLLDLIPVLLGYRPTERITVTVLDRGRLAVTAGQALDGPLDGVPQACAHGDQAFLVAWTTDVDFGIDRVLEVGQELENHGLAVTTFVATDSQVLAVDRDGDVIEEWDRPQRVSAALAQLVANGMVNPHQTREELFANWVEDEDRRAAFNAAFGLGTPTDADKISVWAAIEANMTRDAEVHPGEAAWLARAIEDPELLQHARSLSTTTTAARAFALWRQVAALGVEHDNRAALALAGWSAWLAGNGVGLSWALETAADLNTPFLRELDQINRKAIPPKRS